MLKETLIYNISKKYYFEKIYNKVDIFINDFNFVNSFFSEALITDIGLVQSSISDYCDKEEYQKLLIYKNGFYLVEISKSLFSRLQKIDTENNQGYQLTPEIIKILPNNELFYFETEKDSFLLLGENELYSLKKDKVFFYIEKTETAICFYFVIGKSNINRLKNNICDA